MKRVGFIAAGTALAALAVMPLASQSLEVEAESEATTTLSSRLGVLKLGPPHLKAKVDCATEFFIAPDTIGEPQSISDIRELIEKSPGRILSAMPGCSAKMGGKAAL